MSIETDARQEAERRWYVDHTLRPSMAPGMQEAFVKGAVWAREQDTREPSDAEVEAAARKIYETDAEWSEPGTWFTESEPLRSDYRATARIALLAAQEVRRG